MVRKTVVKIKFMSIFHIKKIIQSGAEATGLTLECLVVTENYTGLFKYVFPFLILMAKRD